MQGPLRQDQGTMTYKTEQEQFWAGEFGTDYAQRNQSEALLAANMSFFSTVIQRTGPLASVTEFGANIGMNLRAISALLPNAKLRAVEINPSACAQLRQLAKVDVVEGSFLDVTEPGAADLAFVKGLLIHISPTRLADAYRALERSGRRWVLIAEYYNPTPVEVDYRGHSGRLFKRDFAGEFLTANPTWHLADYGFLYRRDPVFPQDDITWFLLRRD
jgi:pseudaminic acid biosynthesis-associated methylase